MNEENKILGITLDEASMSRARPEMAHELSIAVQDLLAENSFAPIAGEGPYTLSLRGEEQRLIFDIIGINGYENKISISLQSLKKTIRDYMMICESYYEALTSHAPGKLEAIDMGRRGLHNEGAEALKELMEDKIQVDFCTARRLFTLICVLHMK